MNISFKNDKVNAVFQVSSRMPLLLGDELIPSPGYAIFELVKNSHDAGAHRVVIKLLNVHDRDNGSITVTDDGVGMTIDAIYNSWLVLGSDGKRRKRWAGERAPGDRPFLGEKGIGRFAVHKLGEKIEVITRSKNEPELVINIDWSLFDPDKPSLLGDIPIAIQRREPQWFTGQRRHPATGTRIKITALREPLTRGAVRNLHRDVLSISSPFDARSDFNPELKIDPQQDWLEGLLTINDIKLQAPFFAKCMLHGDQINIEYQHQVPNSLENRFQSRRSINKNFPFPHDSENKESLGLSKAEFERLVKIGPIELQLFMFDLDHAFVRATATDSRGLKRFLAENGGIRVYRNGIRVFGLGGKGEDWLDLGGRRVQLPKMRLSNNQIIGAVLLGESSDDELREQTNRRGFVENEAYSGLKKALVYAITQVEAERFTDKNRLKTLLTGTPPKIPVLDELSDLRKALHELGPEAERSLENVVQRVERAYEETRDTLVTAASTGLTLGGIVHDVEKQVKTLRTEAQRTKPSIENIRAMVEDLSSMMDGLTFLLRKSSNSVESMHTLVASSLRNYAHRFRFHGIEVINGFERQPDFRVRCVRRLVGGNILNLLDNAIWWLNFSGHSPKRIYIGPSRDLGRWPALVIADNGPGFADDPETLVKPFFTRKSDGMGLGLFLADQACIKQGGRLEFPSAADVGLSKDFIGAVLAITLPPEES